MPGTPVVFVHGLWLHATSWDPWLELFARAGYDPGAARWPGEHETVAGARADPGAVAGPGIADIADHVAKTTAALPVPPVLIGHCVGATVVERLLATGHGRAGIGIDPVQVRATPVSPDVADGSVALTADEFFAAFGRAIGRAESDRLHERWAVPSPGRPLAEAAGVDPPAAVRTRNGDRGPLLLVVSGEEPYRPAAVGTDVVAFPDRGRSLVVDAGWRDVAESCLTWLDAYEL